MKHLELTSRIVLAIFSSKLILSKRDKNFERAKKRKAFKKVRRTQKEICEFDII